MNNKGQKYEQLARKFLEKRGLTFIQQNYCCRAGEIDLIMKDNDVYALIEVRFRKSADFGNALESITLAKQQKIVKAAQHFILERQLHNHPIRLDAIGISQHKGLFNQARYEFDWIQHAFTS